MLGWGVLSGLTVHVESEPDGTGADGSRIIVEPGYALDAAGEEISSRAARASPRRRMWTRPSLPCVSGSTRSPSAPGPDQPATTAIEEACIVGLGAEALAPTLALADLVRVNGAWRIDEAYTAPRARCCDATVMAAPGRD